ncbi:MAG: hypothetical protein A2Y82_02705 [Candidatus Buchananbacteria bacterium RBG_13_36_9]|uniref:Bacterial Ig-like domain-containing protein n=1 Tax=Candidatus Buchananbacteria bacterium RBG_13_36_9 TaxID=1797530 RepID=A0A1G1XNT2_9BACT|nr:MAG: hypothetical protein A2Y82_02705 [Candidatus Buchananbacteria bacterium RBG_13_36_9]
MKNIFKILFLFLSIGLLFYANSASAVSSLSNVNLSIQPQTASSLATWKISFTIPETTTLGHIMVSLGGFQPNLSTAEFFVSGLPSGIPQVGKSNPNCVSNCDDIRYYYQEPVEIKKDTRITFTLSNVKNSDKVGPTGLSFINVYSSKYPQTILAYGSGELLVDIAQADLDADENLIPASATSDSEESDMRTTIQKVLLDELFFKEGAKTTRLDKIKDATKVQDFTLDMLGKVKVNFLGTIDLSSKEAINFIASLKDYVTIDFLSFEVKKEFMDYFKVPLQLTFYKVPYAWDADILKDGKDILAKDQVENYHYTTIDGVTQISFIIKEAGSYKLIPKFELTITDNQEIKNKTNPVTFYGRVSDLQAQIKLSLNGKEIKDYQPEINKDTGEFSFALDLLEGPNMIQAQAKSEYGDLPQITKIVQFKPIEITKPPQEEKFSIINIIAISLAVLAVILIYILSRIARKRKR